MLELRKKKVLPEKALLFLKIFLFILILLLFFSSKLKPHEGKNFLPGIVQNIIYWMEPVGNLTKKLRVD